MQQIMTNFGYDKHFFPSHHRITLEQQKLIPHISKDTFGTEKMYLKYLHRQVTTSFSYVCEGFEAVYSLYSKELGLAGKITI